MLGWKKLRQNLIRNKQSNEVYVYTPLPNHKNGYTIEYRHSHFSEIFYYKYKENIDGSLTKYGYLICDHYIRNYGVSKFCKNHKNIGDEVDYKLLFNNNDKECIFYQVVADKIQVALEKRWMIELRKKGKLQISAHDDDDDEWSDLMQHNNICFVSNNIQRRRKTEILDNHDKSNSQVSSPPTSTTKILTTNLTTTSQKSLLNVRRRDKNRVISQEQQQQQSKENTINLTHPKFTKSPVVHIYEPEDTLVYKNCKCSYCVMGEYNE